MGVVKASQENSCEIEIIRGINKLFKGTVNLRHIIDAIREIPEGERTDVIAKSQDLISGVEDGDKIATILKGVFLIPEKQRSKEVIEGIGKLFNDIEYAFNVTPYPISQKFNEDPNVFRILHYR